MSEYAEFIDVDDESMTYTMDYAQYAQVGQVHCLGDEVRELRAKVQELERKVEVQRGTILYWQTQYNWLDVSVNRIFCHYGWGGVGDDNHYKIRRVIDDILALRARVRELKQGNK